MNAFNWLIFALHLAAALTITFGVWIPCDPDIWASRMRVDSYAMPKNSSGLWWGVNEDVARECGKEGTQSSRCFREDLPLYEKEPANLGWHLFALLGHFEWVSSAFAFFYIRGRWNKHSWWVSTAIAGVGALVCMPWRGTVFANEILLIMGNFFVCAGVFYSYRDTHPPQPAAKENAAPVYAERWSVMRIPGDIDNQAEVNADTLRSVDAQAMRFLEYCITASELWVAVLAVFVKDPPAFMALGGYTMILLCNLYGALLHYSLASDSISESSQTPLLIPDQMTMNARRMGANHHPRSRRRRRMMSMHIPDEWLTGSAHEEEIAFYHLQRSVWGSFIASNLSTFLNSWLAYLVAIGIIFYQQTFLFSSDPPFFVVFAGWSLLMFYSSFGFWITLMYYFPGSVMAACKYLPDCLAPRDSNTLTTLGLDVLSVSAKLSIVGSLTFGFVFQAGGRC